MWKLLCEHDGDKTVQWILIKLGTCNVHDEGVNPDKG